MDDLHLEECDQVEAVELANVAVSQMSLGTCPALCSLRASAPFLTLLDLKGCGMLEHLNLNCPSLTTLDATFCGSLGDDALAGALAASPPLEELTLSVCSALGQQGLRSLSSLACLTRLDLSYTEVDDLGPVAVACPQLQVLNLSSCSCLPPDALEALMPRIGGSEARASSSTTPSTATLTSLNVSYCPLPVTSLSRVLAAASSLESLAINGCSGLNDGVWEGLEGLGNGLPHALKYLSLVGCKGLHSCTLGLKKLDSHTWQPYVTRLSQLQELRLGLSGISTLALALPTLTMLDANSCCSLKELELQCPLLLAAYFQVCRGSDMSLAASTSWHCDLILRRCFSLTSPCRRAPVCCRPARKSRGSTCGWP